ncbi:cache domain-containing sensor histidine kinase [Paenibacillus sp. FSL H8-0034]|uniref:cache domain-containing sensor histidine kinase n=1 Tax=Paenibacillus sp. FSL H8-0034 TaxID=2954671 RepID=UPI0030FC1CB6
MPTTFSLTRSLVVKLIVSFSLIIIVTSLLTGAMIYYSNQALFQNEIKSQFFKTNEQTMERLSLKIQEVERITQSIVFQPSVTAILTSSTAAREVPPYSELQQMYDLVSQARLDAPYLRAMFIYNLNGDNYYNANNGAIAMLEPSARQHIEQQLEGSNGALVWLRLKLASSADPEGVRSMIVAARQMKSTWQETYGTLILVLDESFFYEVTRELEGATGQVYLLDRKNRLLFTEQNTPDPSAIPLQFTDDISAITMTGQGKYLFVRKESASVHFKLISGLSLKEIEKKNADIFKMIAFSGLISIVLTGLLLSIVSARLLHPLNELVISMRKIRTGQLKTRIVVRTRDELAFLGESFNDMIDHINTLINEVYVKQLREKEAELRALQAQLNPHFLYNIFNEIYWKLYVQNVRDTAAIIKSLSTILRYSLKPIEQATTLKEELEQIHNYINIQMELFHPDLELLMDIDPLVLPNEIQRLILQPTIENIFVHAFTLRTNVDKKRLTIHAYEQENVLCIDITDNGKGIPSPLLHKLQQPDRDNHREHLGIQNVKRRIELVYGSPFGLQLLSVEGAGTTASYLLPIKKEVQE